MAQLDRFLAVMVSQNATALRLDEGELAELEIGGAPRPVTKTALTGPQVLTLLREIAPASAAASLDMLQTAFFAYTSQDGAFAVDAKHDGVKWRARITLDEKRERQRLTGHFRAAELPPEDEPAPAPAPAPAAAMPPAPPAHAAAPAGGRAGVGAAGDAISSFAGSERARATLDTLLRTMVQKGASDLHLRCGEPPILRLHGEMARMDQAALEPEETDSMIRSIMPERNRQEFTETNDTDYAYEIPGVARFRANAAKDRRGPTAVFRQIPATVVTVEQMGITPEVQRLCQLNKGLVLVTGPTGSGKSTTLCSLIDLVNRSRTDHVITIEDPIEFVHPNKKCIIT
ncbi:MAG: ATPase, T2SS/T4P/T4SS family, partial [Gemmatimonadota bacterium]